jgi:hypothetical protein
MNQTRSRVRDGCLGVVMFCMFSVLSSGIGTAAEGKLFRIPVGEQAVAFEAGYIAPGEKLVGTVIGARENRIYFGAGEILYLRFVRNADVHPGDWVTVYRVTNPVFHPVTTAYMGRIVQVLGVLEIVSEPKNRVAEARVVKPFDSIANGDPVILYTPPAEVPDQTKATDPITGTIVEFKIPRSVTAQGEIVYVDLGIEDGIALGDRLRVIRSGARESLRTFLPDYAVAELKVISVQARTATTKVVRSMKGVQRGDFVVRLISSRSGILDQDSANEESPLSTP